MCVGVCVCVCEAVYGAGDTRERPVYSVTAGIMHNKIYGSPDSLTARAKISPFLVHRFEAFSPIVCLLKR